MAINVTKGFVRVSGRDVHYRVAGQGPAVVMLHDSPRSSLLHIRSLELFSDEFRVYAFDTPGYGQSDPLSAGATIDDFGDALAATLKALGLQGATVYAFHTSSKIALACATRHSDLIGNLLLDGISVPESVASDTFIERYMSAFEPDLTGAYIAKQWTKTRDLHRYFPWFDISPKARMPSAEPSTNLLHEYALDVFSAGKHYADAYAAAMRYDAKPPLSALRVPTTVIARADDVLFGYLDSVETLLSSWGTVKRLSVDPAEWQRTLRDEFRKSRVVSVSSEQRHASTSSVCRQYLEVGGSQLHVIKGGTGKGLVLLHAPPGSGSDLSDLIEAVSDRTVWAPDLPGCGQSNPIPGEQTTERWVQYLLDGLTTSGISDFDIYAEGLASPLALVLGERAGPRVGKIILNGGILLEPARRFELSQNFMPDVRPDRDGVQFWRMFARLRDEQLQWPWFDGSTNARRGGQGLNADQLYKRLIASLHQWEHCAEAAQLALKIDVAAVLATIPQAIYFVFDESDPYYRDVPAAAKLARAGKIVRPFSPDQWQGIPLVLNSVD